MDTVDQTVTAGSSSLSYDPTADQYVYVWKTDKSWTGCRQLQVKLNDGTTHWAMFKFTKQRRSTGPRMSSRGGDAEIPNPGSRWTLRPCEWREWPSRLRGRLPEFGSA